ncbi:MAG: ectoine/hydroxyectoine ABC transporter permease subunit EhuC [Paracoccaceae bacterium]|nr:ectoine/hydroxyectoine ABC transporter permease subunit EhuC [Paracoccaceae bacterium]MDE2914655.1 ectoine/hydroxyectoine ABC transporter permease subunit EhuC [Paracoccaceae bacterium]
MAGRIIAVVALTAFLCGISFATFSELRIFLPAMLRGAVVTLQVSILSAVLFIVMSFLAGIAKDSGTRLVRWLAIGYIEVFRGTSLLVQLFWLYFVLPEFGIVLSPMMAGVLGVGLNFGAYGAEIVRGAMLAVPRGQQEASVALNLSDRACLIRIVIPQAVVVMIPGMTNLTIELIKATALVSAVTLVDITYASVQQNQLHYRTLEIFTITVMLYYCFAQFIRFGGSALEDRFSRHLRRGH